MKIISEEQYSREQYLKALEDRELPHLKSKEAFKGFYDRLGEEDFQDKQEVRRWRMSFIDLGDHNNETIELGCHAGFDLIYYARQGYQITGVDVSTSLIKLAKKKISKESPEVRQRITLINSFIEKLPPEHNGGYNNIVLTETLEHVQNPKTILQKAKSLLKPKGKVFISVPNYRWGNYSHVRGINESGLRQLLHTTGFKINKLYTRRNTTFSIGEI